MATIKAYTDLEQSKKLAEILPIESADMSWCNSSIKGINYIDPWHTELKTPIEIESIFNEAFIFDWKTWWKIIPCWSLAALINLLPSEFTTENKFGIFKYTIRIRKYKFTEDEDVHQIAYGNYKYYEDGSSWWKDMINTGEKEELLDAVFDMICQLHKQNLFDYETNRQIRSSSGDK